MKKHFVIISAVICVIAVCVTAVILFMTSGKKAQTDTDFEPPEFEKSAKTGVPDVPEDTGYGSIDAKLYEFSLCGNPILSDGGADIYLTNHSESGVWLKARLYNGSGKCIGESSLLKEGEYLKSVKLSDNTENNIQIKIMAYQPDTYYSMGSVVINVMLT